MGKNMDQDPSTTTKIAVQGAVNSQGTNIKATGINNEYVQQQIIHKDGPRNGATCEVETVDGCKKPIIKTAVPAEDGLTRIEVECEEGRRLGWTYSTNIRSNWPILSTWLFRGVPGDTMPISEKESNEFFKMNSEFETKYRSKLHKASDGCLHLQFLHETEEEAKRMCEDKEFVKKRFLQYMAGVGKDATSCTVEASYTHVASSPKQAEYIPNKDSYATSESGDAKGIGGTTFDNDSSSENSDESFFSLDGDEDSDRQTHNVLDRKIPSTSAEEDSENEDTSTQIQSTQLASYSKRDNQADMDAAIRKKLPFRKEGSIHQGAVLGGTGMTERPVSFADVMVTGGSVTSSVSGIDHGDAASRKKLPFREEDLTVQGAVSGGKTILGSDISIINRTITDAASRKKLPFREEDLTVQGAVLGGKTISIINRTITDCQHCHNYKKRWGQLPVGLKSLKKMARSALSHHALPAPIIKIYGCLMCSKLIEAAGRESKAGKHVFFIHLFDESSYRQCFCERMQYQMKKILSALRNKHGGILYVHSFGRIEDTRSFVDSILSTLTSPDETVLDVFECEFVKTCSKILRIDVERSATFITADLKTKQPTCMLKYQSVSLDTLKSRLFSQRTVQNTAPTLQGVSYIKHGKAVVQLFADVLMDTWSYGYRSVDRSLSDTVSELVDEVHLSEHVSSLSNRRNGGNIFVGWEEAFHLGKLEGLNIASPGKWRVDEFKRTLEQELLSRICVSGNKNSDMNDVFTIGIHNTGDDKYIIEVAVGPVNGCVFHDALGPASFELEEREIARLKYDACVRLSFDDWLKRTFPEMKTGNTEHK